jgi:hypothetical protein
MEMCPRPVAFIAALLLLLTPLNALKTSGPSCAVPEAPRFLALPRCPATTKTLADAKNGARPALALSRGPSSGGAARVWASLLQGWRVSAPPATLPPLAGGGLVPYLNQYGPGASGACGRHIISLTSFPRPCPVPAWPPVLCSCLAVCPHHLCPPA